MKHRLIYHSMSQKSQGSNYVIWMHMECQLRKAKLKGADPMDARASRRGLSIQVQLLPPVALDSRFVCFKFDTCWCFLNFVCSQGHVRFESFSFHPACLRLAAIAWHSPAVYVGKRAMHISWMRSDEISKQMSRRVSRPVLSKGFWQRKTMYGWH